MRKCLASGEFPEIMPCRARATQAAAYEPLIRQRLADGYTTMHQLHADLRAAGYSGSESALGRYVHNRLKWHKRSAQAPAIRSRRSM